MGQHQSLHIHTEKDVLFLGYSISHQLGAPSGKGMSDNARPRSEVPSYIYLLWKPLHIPSASSFNISDDKLKALEVEGGNSIETNVK